MIKLKLFKQSKGYCGPASLKMALSVYGINKSEKYLAKLTKSSRSKGCSEENITNVAKMFGLKSKIKKRSSISEVKKLVNKGIPVIVNWFSPQEAGHYSVVVGFDKNKIVLADPHFGKIVKKDISWFEGRWFDVWNDKLILRQIIIIGEGK